MGISLRFAIDSDAPHLVALIHQLAASIGETSPLTPEYVHRYLSTPGSNILLAINDTQVVGLLSYSIRPNLYHAGDSALIEEFVVDESARGKGVGDALLQDLVARLEALGCAEVSVSTMPDNAGAIRFYRAHGLTDEAILLEKHFAVAASD